MPTVGGDDVETPVAVVPVPVQDTQPGALQVLPGPRGFKTPEYLYRGSGDAVATPAEWVGQQLPPGSLHEAPKDAKVIDRLGDWLVLDKKQGGWGEVYLCVPSQGARLAFALKSYPSAKARIATVRSVFEHECVTSMLVSSAFGVLPYSVDVIDGRLFLVMPAGDMSLRDKLTRGPTPFDEAVSTARVVAIALDEAARCVPGLVHGDLKPENIFMVYRVPHVADFGLARSAARWAGDMLKGTDGYSAPEAGDPAAALSVSADVYSYGVVLAELLASATPRRGPSAWLHGRAKHQSTRQALLDLATRCRAHSPGDRPADFAVVRDELERIVPEAAWPLPREAVVMRALTPLINAMATHDGVIAAGLQRLGQHAMVLDLVARTAPDARNWQLWMREGIALSELGRDEEALRSYKAAIEVLDPEDPAQAQHRWLVFLQAAISLKRLRYYEDAQQKLQTLVTSAPDDVSAFRAAWNVAGVWADAGRYAQAELLMSQLLTGSLGMAEEASMWAKLAIVRLEAGDPLRAADALRRATAVEPATAEWHDRLGCLLMGELGWLDEAGVARSATPWTAEARTSDFSSGRWPARSLSATRQAGRWCCVAWAPRSARTRSCPPCGWLSCRHSGTSGNSVAQTARPAVIFPPKWPTP
ncbi:MAG TPA: protein kinase family protein [Streptosporangiaceae bacterium]|nr:protein kinase family protein [Streptosporangiaceae bacterium]